DYIGLLFGFGSLVQPLYEVFYRHFTLWNQRSSSATSDAGIDRNKACISSHYFHKEKPVVRRSRVPDFVYGLNGRITGGIEANRTIGTRKIIIYGTRQTYGRDAIFFEQKVGACEGSVSADDHQSVDTMLLEIIVGPLSALWRTEGCTSCRPEKGSPSFKNIRDI